MWYNTGVIELKTVAGAALAMLSRLTPRLEVVMLPDHTTPQDAPQLKTCSKCGIAKPATPEFYSRDKQKPDGLYPYCKSCNSAFRAANRERISESRRDYYAANRERIAAQKRVYYAANTEKIAERGRAYYAANRERARAYREANKEHIAESARAYRAANPERFLAYRGRYTESARAYRAANKEHIAKRILTWTRANPDKARAYKLRRRAREVGAQGAHTSEDIQAQYKRQKGRCFWCGEKVGDTYHADHVVPLSRGGTNDIDNLVIACPSCNCSKQDKLPHEWIQGGRLL